MSQAGSHETIATSLDDLVLDLDEDDLDINTDSTAASDNDSFRSEENSDTTTDSTTSPERSPVGSAVTRCAMEACQTSEDVSFCYGCSAAYCEPCWNTLPPHRLDSRLRAQHERIDLKLAERIQNAIRPDRDSETTIRLHEEDKETSWFGIAKTQEMDLGFGANRRYENLLADFSSRSRSNVYPSLVSFIGETGPLHDLAVASTILTSMIGAGKSGIINLLITVSWQKLQKVIC